MRKEYLKDIRDTEHPFTQMLKKWGTGSFTSPSIAGGDTPIKNWSLYGEEGFPNHAKINGDDDFIARYQTKKHACLGCPVGCKGWVRIESKAYGVVEGTKPEYETLGMLGSNCLVDDIKAIAKANDMCNRYGLDTITVGSVIGFAMECYERGVINKDDTGGIELTWGNADSMVAR